MGGYGSGNWRKKRKTTNDFSSIDIRLLQRAGYLISGHSHTNQLVYETHTESVTIKTESDNTLIIIYRCSNNKANHGVYKFKIDWMPCNYGGKRAFFLCPLCERRISLLYCVSRFACRHCHSLTYACQGEKAEYRYARQADKIRTRLGWKLGILNGMGEKPKGMHVETFDRLLLKQMRYATKVLDSMAKDLGLKI